MKINNWDLSLLEHFNSVRNSFISLLTLTDWLHHANEHRYLQWMNTIGELVTKMQRKEETRLEFLCCKGRKICGAMGHSPPDSFQCWIGRRQRVWVFSFFFKGYPEAFARESLSQGCAAGRNKFLSCNKFLSTCIFKQLPQGVILQYRLARAISDAAF